MYQKYTNKLLKLLDDGILSHEDVIDACLAYLGEHDVKELMQVNDFPMGDCSYCGGDCPEDPDNACDGYLGDIDELDHEQVV
jgi:hypothetical protein